MGNPEREKKGRTVPRVQRKKEKLSMWAGRWDGKKQKERRGKAGRSRSQ